MAHLPSPAPLVRALLGITLVLVIDGCREDAQAPTEAGAAPQLAVSGQPLSFRQIAAGTAYTCGVTTANVAYCWGNDVAGQLGDGSRTNRLRPVKVAGGLKFIEVRPGAGTTCGLTTDSLAYCWGDNTHGALGDNSTAERRLVPTLVFGGHHWRQVIAGPGYACGIAAGGAAYCWGSNDHGVLGASSSIFFSRKPVKVSGGLKFRRVLPGNTHTCGATTDNRAYCWGDNALGQLGDGTRTDHATPTLVAGGLSWQLVVPGSGFISPVGGGSPDFAYTCGLNTDDRLYCWGTSVVQRFGLTPVALATNRRFQSVKAADFHTCALTVSGAALCWGLNADGELGTGGSETATPTAVAGGHTFSVVTAPVVGQHSCGVTTDHHAFCWGDNSSGQLGDGTQGTDRPTPAAVVGPS